MEKIIYKLWWSEKGDGVGGVGVMKKTDLCERVVEIERMVDNVMALVHVLKMCRC